MTIMSKRDKCACALTTLVVTGAVIFTIFMFIDMANFHKLDCADGFDTYYIEMVNGTNATTDNKEKSVVLETMGLETVLVSNEETMTWRKKEGDDFWGNWDIQTETHNGTLYQSSIEMYRAVLRLGSARYTSTSVVRHSIPRVIYISSKNESVGYFHSNVRINNEYKVCVNNNFTETDHLLVLGSAITFSMAPQKRRK